MRSQIVLPSVVLLSVAAILSVAATTTRSTPSDGEAAPRTASVDGPLKAVYCTHSAGFRHPVLPESREIMTRLGAELPWMDITVTNDVADLTPEVFESLDVLVLYTSGTLPMSDEQRRALQAFVARGGGVVGIHSASDTFHDWPWFVETMGGAFESHPWHETVGVTVLETDHPSTAHLGSRFEILDEIYQFRRLNEARRTLLELDTESVDHDVQPGRPYPLAWTLVPGKGRVFYTALGHRPSVWRDQRFVDHVLGGIRWAGGDDRVVPGPPAPGRPPSHGAGPAGSAGTGPAAPGS